MDSAWHVYACFVCCRAADGQLCVSPCPDTDPEGSNCRGMRDRGRLWLNISPSLTHSVLVFFSSGSQLGEAVTKNPGYLKLRRIRAAQNIAKTVRPSMAYFGLCVRICPTQFLSALLFPFLVPGLHYSCPLHLSKANK